MSYSASSISTYAACPLRFHYRYNLHLRPRSGNTHHLAFGAAMHGALAIGYSGGTMEQMETALKAGYPVQVDINDRAKTLPNGIATLHAYSDHYGFDLDKWEILECEQLARGEDDFVVKLDLVVKERDTGEIFGVDHKITGSYLDYKFFAKFEPNNQVAEYIRYIKEKYGQCDGFIINAIGMKFRSRAYKGEPAGFWCNFERQTFTCNEYQLEQNIESRNQWIKQIEVTKANGIYPMNTDECWSCDYRDLCKVGRVWPVDRDLMLLEYVQVCSKRIEASGDYCNLELEHLGECAYQIVVAPDNDGWTVEIG